MSADISALSDDVNSIYSSIEKLEQVDAGLSVAVDNKIFIDGLSAQCLSAIHINQEDFHEKVLCGQILSNELYIVSSDFINAYGQQVKNMSAATDLSDAVNFEQLLSVRSDVSTSINSIMSNLYSSLSVIDIDPLSSLDESSKMSTLISAVLDIRDTLKTMRLVLQSIIEQ